MQHAWNSEKIMEIEGSGVAKIKNKMCAQEKS